MQTNTDKSCVIPNTTEKTATTTTVLKIPKQSSKPRIFLLTRPAKLPLVRKIIPQTVEAHQNGLNPELPHPLETTKKKPQEIKIIKIEKVHHQPHQPLKLESIRKLPENLVAIRQQQQQHQQHILNSYKSKSQDSSVLLEENQKSIIQSLPRQSVKSTTATTTTRIQENNTVQQAAYLNKSAAQTNRQVVIGKKPSTLASMAGIELTGADMSPTAADMSGAMPPTATVEEINVPVFIDEYLQEAAISNLSATSGTSVTTQNINNNSNNNYNNYHNNNNGVDEPFDGQFEFNIELLTETTNKDQDKENLLGQACQEPAPQSQQQPEQQQHQDIQNLNYDEFDMMDPIDPIMDNAIDIPLFNNEECTLLEDLSQNAAANNSQSIFNFDDPMFSNASSVFTSSQPFQLARSSSSIAEEIKKAEPYVSPPPNPNEYWILETPATSSSSAMAAANETNSSAYIFLDDADLGSMMQENSLKRPQSSQTQQHMREKREKLHLDTKRRRESAAEDMVLDTPGVVKLLDDMAIPVCLKTEETSKDIFNNLIACSPHDSSSSSSNIIDNIKTEINLDYNSNDITPPYTPYSVNSSNSNHTNFSGIINILQQPHSPALSVATTSTTTTKRGRGRPAKVHSDMPDLSQLARLPESEQKKILERAKNNEASRKSRLKNKEREEALEREERVLMQRHHQLNEELQELLCMEKKFKRACKRNRK
ncbi:probable serine/threonine-protein kinase MARK-A [Musca vetustissima]|uniref:probable serine/threonine-protein kinase MARK-A n=1 Tax=Musca vetustissima TaxID=27455 RepID=UPI002AB642BE|nr:probable serine/threonine-protein kinase MARK-A [Musca vetustissima]